MKRGKINCKKLVSGKEGTRTYSFNLTVPLKTIHLKLKKALRSLCGRKTKPIKTNQRFWHKGFCKVCVRIMQLKTQA